MTAKSIFCAVLFTVAAILGGCQSTSGHDYYTEGFGHYDVSGP